MMRSYFKRPRRLLLPILIAVQPLRKLTGDRVIRLRHQDRTRKC